MNIQVLKISPMVAAELIKSNTRNRNLNAKLVADYARAMTNGEWTVNGEAIKIAEDGTLLDGQHRLSAIVLSGVTVEILVVEGLPLESQFTMDTGRKRSTSDVLAIQGVANYVNLAAVARRVWMWDQGNAKFPSSPTPSTPELLAVIEKYPTLHRSAEIGTRVSLGFRPSRAAAVAMSHHLFLPVDADLTAQFFAYFETGAGLTPGHPILALRERIVRDKLTSKAVPFHLSVALQVRAWNAMRDGRTLQRIQHTAEEPMILPV